MKRVPAITGVLRRAITLTDLKSADEVLTMDVGVQVSSVHSLNGERVGWGNDDAVGPITAAVQLAYSNIVTDESLWEAIPTWPRKE